jgi:hypothetical protein
MRASFGFEPMPRVKYLIALGLLAVAGATVARAADIPNFPKARAAPAAPSNGLPANCAEWTDGCRVCARQQDGGAACSNVGIACLPQTVRCTRP